MVVHFHGRIGLFQKPQTLFVRLIQRPQLCLTHTHKKKKKKSDETFIENLKQSLRERERERERERDLCGFAAKGSGGKGRDRVTELVPFEDSEAVGVNRG